MEYRIILLVVCLLSGALGFSGSSMNLSQTFPSSLYSTVKPIVRNTPFLIQTVAMLPSPSSSKQPTSSVLFMHSDELTPTPTSPLSGTEKLTPFPQSILSSLTFSKPIPSSRITSSLLSTAEAFTPSYRITSFSLSHLSTTEQLTKSFSILSSLPLSSLLLSSVSSSSDILPTPSISLLSTPILTSSIVSTVPSPESFPVIAAFVPVVVVVLIFSVLMLICGFLIVRKRMKYHHYTFETQGEDIMKKEDFPLTQEQIINFGASVDVFGIEPQPSNPKPIDFPETPAPKDGSSLPALVFINAVNPDIPIISNIEEGSKTLPNTMKLKTTDQFEAPEEKESSHLPKGELKVSKSTGAIKEGLLVFQPPNEKLQLPGMHEDKRQVESPVYDSPKSTEQFATSTKAKTGRNQNDGYVCMEPFSKSSNTMGSGLKSSDSGTLQFHETSEPLVQCNDNNTNMSVSHIERSIIPELDSSFSVDTSHYDVPRKLLEARAAVCKQECKLHDNTKNTTTTSLPGDTQISKLDPPILSTITNKPVTTSVSKPEGIYDVPRSLKETFKNPLLKSGAQSESGYAKPAIAVKSKMPIDPVSKPEGVYDNPVSVILYSTQKKNLISNEDLSISLKEKSVARQRSSDVISKEKNWKARQVLADVNKDQTPRDKCTKQSSLTKSLGGEGNNHVGRVKILSDGRPKVLPKPKSVLRRTPMSETATSPNSDGKTKPLPRSRTTMKGSIYHHQLMPATIIEEKKAIGQDKEP